MKTTSWQIQQYVPDSDDDDEEDSPGNNENGQHKDIGDQNEQLPRPLEEEDDELNTSNDIPISNKQEERETEDVIVVQQYPGRALHKTDRLSQKTDAAVQSINTAIEDRHGGTPTSDIWKTDDHEEERLPYDAPLLQEDDAASLSSLSPLSSISSSPAPPSPRYLSQQDQEQSQTLPTHSGFEDISEILARQEWRPARQLRERKAIQLNPYAIEGQMYKQAWRSRGLVPLQVKNDSQIETNEAAQLSSSQLEYESSQDARSISNPHVDDDGMEMNVGTSPTKGNFSSSPHLPELPQEQFEDRPTKRRKVAHTYSKKNLHQGRVSPLRGLHVREDGWIEVPFAHDKTVSPTRQSHQDTTRKKHVSKSTSSAPPAMTPVSVLSSPSTASVTLPDPLGLVDKKTSLDRNVIAQQLRTPATSSDGPSHRKEKAHQSFISPPQQPASRTQTNSVIHVDSASEDEEMDDDQILRQISRAQRRTKGVLPASWHRLEYQKLLNKKPQGIQKQQVTSRRHHPGVTSPLKDTGKGIARRITGTQHRRHESNAELIPQAIVDIESDSSDNDGLAAQIKQQQAIIDFYPINDNFISFDYDDDNDTNIEDNSIDPMIGRESQAKSHRPQKKNTKQSKMRDYTILQRHPGTYNGESSSNARRRNAANSQTPTKRPKSNNRQSRIRNILDATNGLAREQTPNFLAYAVRTARKRTRQAHQLRTKQHGRPSKAKKIKRHLQPMHQAEGGNITSDTELPRPPRRPLHGRSSNNSRSQIFLDDDETATDLEDENRAKLNAISTTVQIARRLSSGDEATSDQPVAPVCRNKYVVKGYPIASATSLIHSVAPAHLETVNNNHRSHHGNRRDRRLVLDRFLERSVSQARQSSTVLPQAGFTIKTTQNVRKRPPRQVPISLIQEHDQNEQLEVFPEEITSNEALPATRPSSSKLQGLLPLGKEYSTTFSINRLPDGCHFSASTLLGSGLFSKSLNTFRKPVNHDSFRSIVEGEAVEWGGWNEATSQQIFSICNDAVSLATRSRHAEIPPSALADNLIQSLRLVIQYLSENLRFLDPIDCKDFVVRWKTAMNKYDNQFRAAWMDRLPKTRYPPFVADITCSITIIGNQIQQIAEHSIIDQQIKTSVSEASASILRHLTATTLEDGVKDLQLFSQDPVNLLDHASRREVSRKSESLVIISHLRGKTGSSTWTVWDTFKESGLLTPPHEVAVPVLERNWKILFSLLPILELDDKGYAPTSIPPLSRPNNWKFVKQLIQPVFNAYSHSTQRSSLHLYCQALYARCYWVLDYWGWNDCESIMGFLFDFFAQNKLHDLSMEFNLGSASFLTNLTSTTRLETRSSDSCFQLLLKIIGKGLKLMRTQHKDKRISNCVWRLTPNHDRSLPKDKSLRQEDLNAVRNHLDLLAVLYWAAPPQYRIRVDLIQRLIDIESSHKEVCHLAIKTWSNLVTFQLSTQEPAGKLEAFMQWYEDIIAKLTKLHQLARTEVESDARRAEALRGQHFSRDDQERIIQASQGNIQSILNDALLSLKAAILKSETIENLRKMLPGCLRSVLELWAGPRPNTSQIVTHTLDVIQAWTLRARQLRNTEDSQGYGDWSGFQELELDIEKPISLTIPNDVQAALQDFMSRIFGSEIMIDDGLLQKSINCWLDVVEVEVTIGFLAWDDLMDPYSPKSWMALRDTAQTRRLTPMFLSLLLQKDGGLYQRKKLVIIQCWIECLVERESLIRYQPDLTSALLNQDSTEPLFQNHPFSKEHDAFRISLTDFLDRRISLIACVLSNMRESISFSRYHQLQDYQAKRKNYSELLRHLMTTMKTNYQSLGQGSIVQGAYVTFTQKVVQLLQEHTTDICKVDGFFLDAVNFPLPVEDPEYLVSKFKSLALQLRHSRGSQQLVAFIQSVCERAVIEGKQDHFASLVFSATEGAFEASDGEHLTLRFFICCELLPDYIHIISSTPCGWVVAETLLLSSPMMLRSLTQNIDAFDKTSMVAAGLIISTVMDSICHALAIILGPQSDPGHRTSTIVTHYFTIGEAALEISDYLGRCSVDMSERYTDLMVFLADAAIYTLIKVEQPNSCANCPDLPASIHFLDNDQPSRFEAARRFARESLYGSLDQSSHKCKWRIDGGKLLVHRNARWDVVSFDLGSQDQRQQKLLTSARSLLDKMQRTPLFGWIVTEGLSGQPHLLGMRSVATELNELLGVEQGYSC